MIAGPHLPLGFAAGPPPLPTPGGRPDRTGTAITAAHVLVIEDEAMIAWMIEGLLEDMGFTSIAIAADGEEALRLAAADPPALVISDINLGNSPDGIETVAAIRSTAPARAIFVSGYASIDARARIDQTIPGATVLRKPIEVEPLRRAVEAALAPRPN